jgi:hydroxymethylbilane synthase
MTAIRIATRGSRLALWQAGWVRDRLAAAWPGRPLEIFKIETRGDRLLDQPLPQIGGKGLFTEALGHALLAGDADLAVHSLKDLPTELPAGLKVGAVCEREDARDVWLARADGPASPAELQAGMVVGTSSERRRAQVLALRPDVKVRPIRGNVETRLRKLDEGGYDALIMAAAGLTRLGFRDRINAYLDPPDWLSAPGQGAIAVECRSEEPALDELLDPIEDAAARAETDAERALLARLQGGCQVPVGARARVVQGDLRLEALVALADGSRVIRADGCGLPERAVELGIEVADHLLARGGDAIVATFRAIGQKGSP